MNQQKAQAETKTSTGLDILPCHPLFSVKKTGHYRKQFEVKDNGEIYFDGYRDYIQEYTEVKREWQDKCLNMETVTYAKACEYHKALNNALEHTGLDHDELLLIAYCRMYSRFNAFRQVHEFFRKLKRFLDETEHVDITICDD